MRSPRLRAAALLLAAFATFAAASSAAAETCDKLLAASPQYSLQNCVFQNDQNPRQQPSQPAWKVWSRFLKAAPPGTTPVDAIPVRKLNRAALDALDSTGGGRLLYPVHNGTFNLTFHTLQDPLERVAALAQAKGWRWPRPRSVKC